MNIVCSACSSVNRVPDEKRADKPVCGKCKEQLLPAHPITLTDTTFAKFIARTERRIVVDFWAPWCGPCRTMAPAFAEAAAQISPRVILAKLDTQANPSAPVALQHYSHTHNDFIQIWQRSRPPIGSLEHTANHPVRNFPLVSQLRYHECGGARTRACSRPCRLLGVLQQIRIR